MKRKCLGCGKEFEPAAGRQRYCTKRCCQISYRKRKVPSYRAVKKCVICGKEFIPFKSTRQTCSEFCRVEAANRRCRERRLERKMSGEVITRVSIGTEAECLECGKKFKVRSGTQKYCSDACRKMAHNRRIREKTPGKYRRVNSAELVKVLNERDLAMKTAAYMAGIDYFTILRLTVSDTKIYSKTAEKLIKTFGEQTVNKELIK